jgi:hypothetical protein
MSSVLLSRACILHARAFKQGGEDAEKEAAAGTPGSGAAGGALDAGGEEDAEDWDNEDADHFCCAISMDIMKDPVRIPSVSSPQ